MNSEYIELLNEKKTFSCLSDEIVVFQYGIFKTLVYKNFSICAFENDKIQYGIIDGYDHPLRKKTIVKLFDKNVIKKNNDSLIRYGQIDKRIKTLYDLLHKNKLFDKFGYDLDLLPYWTLNEEGELIRSKVRNLWNRKL